MYLHWKLKVLFIQVRLEEKVHIEYKNNFCLNSSKIYFKEGYIYNKQFKML